MFQFPQFLSFNTLPSFQQQQQQKQKASEKSRIKNKNPGPKETQQVSELDPDITQLLEFSDQKLKNYD